MQVINLDKNFRPYGQGLQFQAFTFNGGEPHIRITDEIKPDEYTIITHRVRTMNDFMTMILCLDAVTRIYNAARLSKKIKLVLPYFPGARQDRVCNPGEPFTLEVFAKIINSYQLEEIIVLDPHSPMVQKKINRCKAIDATNFIAKCIQDLNLKPVLVAPDKGAKESVNTIAENIGLRKVVQGIKKRNLETGRITELIIDSEDLKGQDCLVVDDICDGGATFLRLALALKAKNAGRLYLAVSHGIFSKGLDQLLEHYEQLYTSDSFTDIKHPKLTRLLLKGSSENYILARSENFQFS